MIGPMAVEGAVNTVVNAMHQWVRTGFEVECGFQVVQVLGGQLHLEHASQLGNVDWVVHDGILDVQWLFYFQVALPVLCVWSTVCAKTLPHQ